MVGSNNNAVCHGKIRRYRRKFGSIFSKTGKIIQMRMSKAEIRPIWVLVSHPSSRERLDRSEALTMIRGFSQRRADSWGNTGPLHLSRV